MHATAATTVSTSTNLIADATSNFLSTTSATTKVEGVNVKISREFLGRS